jgi:hypothetical protein
MNPGPMSHKKRIQRNRVFLDIVYFYRYRTSTNHDFRAVLVRDKNQDCEKGLQVPGCRYRSDEYRYRSTYNHKM